jgi:hypothetical protein
MSSICPAQLRTSAEIRALASYESIREERGHLSASDLVDGIVLDRVITVSVGRGAADDLLAAAADGWELTVPATFTLADVGRIDLSVDALAAALATAEARHAEWLRAA